MLVSKNQDIQDQLSNLKLNINADVNLLSSDGNDTFSVYDIYNPAFDHGGYLHFDKIGYYSKNFGYRISMKTNKYWIRRNMTGIKFKSAIVVIKLLLITCNEDIEFKV